MDPDLKVSVSEDQIVTDAKDPWGTTYRIVYSEPDSTRGQIVITSAGSDLQFDTDDDINISIRFVITENGGQVEIENSTGKAEGTGGSDADPIWGDADGDGVVTESDATLLLNYSSQTIDSAQLNLSVCEVSGDGVIDLVDSMLVLQYATKEICDFPISGNSGVWGDANNDREVTTDDMTLTLNYASQSADEIYFKAADVNGDGSITAADGMLIGQFVNGTITTFPVQETASDTVTLPAENPTGVLNDYSWSEIQVFAQAGLTADEYKSKYGIELGQKVADIYVLVDFDAYGGFVFMYQSGQSMTMNSTAINAGGYAASELAIKVEALYENLDVNLKAVIKTVTIQCNDGSAYYSAGNAETATHEYTCHLFLASATEVGFDMSGYTHPDSYTAEGEAFAYFADNATRQNVGGSSSGGAVAFC